MLPGYFCTWPDGYRQRLGFQDTKQEMLFPDPHWEEIEIRVVLIVWIAINTIFNMMSYWASVDKTFVATDLENHTIQLMQNGTVTEILFFLGELGA